MASYTRFCASVIPSLGRSGKRGGEDWAPTTLATPKSEAPTATAMATLSMGRVSF
jgi:hypothetical protein